MADTFALSLSVTSESTDNMDDMFNELNDLGNVGVASGTSTLYILEA